MRRAFSFAFIATSRGKSMMQHNRCSSSLVVNPLIDETGLPAFDRISPEHVEPAVVSSLEAFNEGFKTLEQGWAMGSPKSYEQVIDAMERVGAPLFSCWSVVGHLTSVKNSDELRAVHEKMQPIVVEAFQKVGQSKPLYDALNSIDKKTLDLTQLRIVEKEIKSMERSGIGLEKSMQEKFNKLKLESAELSTKFSNNLLDSQKYFKLELVDKVDMEGLPASALGLYSKYAQDSGHDESTPEHGPWVITLDGPSYVPFMQHAKSSKLRELVYRAFITRASTGEKDNSVIIQRLLVIRKEIASMLGYGSYAEMSLATKMAKSEGKVMDLISLLHGKTMDYALDEVKKLKEYSKMDKLNPWDVAYWSERLKEDKFEFEEEALRPYFPLQGVLQGMFDLSNKLFGIKVIPADGETSVWNPDVGFFTIVDEQSGKKIASFFLDPYSRPAEKRGGAWMASCQGRSNVFKRLPVAYLICNGSPPVAGKPSLMSFRDVETLFHEFGHSLQHMLTEIQHSDAAGINGIEWDAVELPSQFMENWCWHQDTLLSFAKHYETGQVLPDELFAKLKAGKNYHAGMTMLRQLQFGALDITLHSSKYDPKGAKTPFDLQQELSKEYSVIPPLPEDRFLCGFSHIFAGGYSAGYYSYKWAEVMSADAFAAFEEVGLENDAAIAETGKRFRATVLSLGGSRDPTEVYREFRGRDPTPEALLRHSGLTSPLSKL